MMMRLTKMLVWMKEKDQFSVFRRKECKLSSDVVNELLGAGAGSGKDALEGALGGLLHRDEFVGIAADKLQTTRALRAVPRVVAVGKLHGLREAAARRWLLPPSKRPVRHRHVVERTRLEHPSVVVVTLIWERKTCVMMT